ncbi:MAG: sensor domain-containing diguanylate cyclase [Oscillospiraceae bacterium]|nr:sensor domain-containing diguanylate cyclase [Oscillospiraceae bacterium]
MNCIWNFFDNINELVYVSDMDNHEIIYMNKKCMEVCGVSDFGELKGRKCYEVIQGNSSPCAACTNDKLTEGEFMEYKFFNTFLNKHLLVMNTMRTESDRRCRFELAVDISRHEASAQSLDRYEELEKRVNDGIKHAACETDPDKSLNIILEFLGKTLKGDRAYIFEKNTHGDDNTYEWTAAGVTPEKDNLQNLPPEVCENWYRYFSENKNVMFDDIEKMRRDDPLQYENLKGQNIRSIVVVPLYDDNRVIGFYGIDNPPGQALEQTLNMLQIVGYFISSMIKRRDMINRLREISLCDWLTKLGNRHAMNEYISGIDENKSLGIVYCDITRLKRINDTMGHKKGDELICRAADSLKSAFGGHGLFRIGGDELLAICVDIDEYSLHGRTKLLREKAAENSVNLAIGAVWKRNHENDVQKLMSEAEKLMYSEKSEYYRRVGIDRRK